jgi:hypothetical protein
MEGDAHRTDHFRLQHAPSCQPRAVPRGFMPRYISYLVSPFLSLRSTLPPSHTHPPPREPMSAADYDLLEGHFDLSTEFEQEAPPYLPNARPPTYTSNYYPCLSPHVMDSPSQYAPHEHHLSAVGGELSPGAGPDDASKFPSSALLSPQNADNSLGIPSRVIGV